MNTVFKPTGKFRKDGEYPVRDLDEICGNCNNILGKHRALSESCTEKIEISLAELTDNAPSEACTNTAVSNSGRHCKLTFKGRERFGYIVDTKMDKLKIEILDGRNAGEGHIIKTDWFQNNEIKRIWL